MKITTESAPSHARLVRQLFQICFAIILSIWTATLLSSTADATTGNANEITNIHLENVTQTSADVVWDTVHPSTSQVILARDVLYSPERWVPVAPDPNLVTHHRVKVDQLVPYSSLTGDGVYYYYVASVDVNNNLYTNPGPSDPTGSQNITFLKIQTLSTITDGSVRYSFSLWGATNVFAGSDLYLQVKNVLVAGPVGSNLTIIYQGTKDGNHDGLVKDSNNNVVNSMDVHFQCINYDATGDHSNDQVTGSPYNFCWGRNYYTSDSDVRVRVPANTPPGAYTVTVTLSPDGQLAHAASYTYAFNVLAPATFVATPPNSFPPIPGLSTWETQMTSLGGYWCDGKNSSSRDSLNASGNFLVGFGWYADAWNYDGGRVYQQIDTYTANHGAANHPRWQHCALTILDPYRQWINANNAALQAPAIFPYGMAMNYWRTREATNKTAVDNLATKDGFAPYTGYIDPYWVRETAYQIDVWIASEMMGHARYPQLQPAVDKLVGQMDQFANQNPSPLMYPFMTGIAMEALINWYEMNAKEGTPDYRIPYVVKGVLDKLWAQNWLSDGYSLLYNPYNIPNLDNFTELNDLVAPAYAWYWSKTGDDTYLQRGDLLFAHTFDTPGSYDWSGKQFSQIYKWSFDYVAWRTGTVDSTVMQNSNPYSGTYSDTEPPIETKVTAQNITTNAANISWTTYEVADSQVYYGLTSKYTNSTQLIDTGQNRKTSHLVSMTGLKTKTTYHFQVRSKDAAGNLASSLDYTFTTK